MAIYGTTIRSVIEDLALAPVKHPEILPSVLPLILGAVVIELYFGRHSNESLGWNTSVGNAIIWIATGATLFVTHDLTTMEQNVVFGLIGAGVFLALMDFYHLWPSRIAFMVSSAGVIYTLAYITVVWVKTDMVFDETVVKGAAIFFVGINIIFKVVQLFEPSSNDGFNV